MVGVEGPFSQLRAGPSESDLARLEEEISKRLGTVEVRSAGTANFPAEPKLAGEPKLPAEAAASIEAAQPAFTPITPPRQVRQARKLIGGAAVVVAAGLAFFSYYAWRVHKEPFDRIPSPPAVPTAQLPVTALPETPPAPVAAPAPPPAAPARPAAAAATISRASPPAGPIAVPTSGPRAPAVTHTLRDEPEAKPAAAAVATVPAAAAPPAAAPNDCPEAIVALGLCASQARKGMK